MDESLEQRKQFTFFRSYYEALQFLPDKDRLKAYDAICEYALNGNEITAKGAAAATFILIKPVLDAGRSRAIAGGAGGRKQSSTSQAPVKQTASKPQANRKQTASKAEDPSKQPARDNKEYDYKENDYLGDRKKEEKEERPTASETCDGYPSIRPDEKKAIDYAGLYQAAVRNGWPQAERYRQQAIRAGQITEDST